MSALPGLPPLPASLSAVLADSLTGVRPPPAPIEEPTYSNVPAPAPGGSPPAAAGYGRHDRAGSSGSAGRRAGPLLPLPRTSTTSRRASQLEQQLERLRLRMSELRQLDLSLLYQLWSLNDAIQELKQAVRSPSWDNGYDGSADDEDAPPRGLSSVSERLSSSSSSSLEFGNI